MLCIGCYSDHLFSQLQIEKIRPWNFPWTDFCFSDGWIFCGYSFKNRSNFRMFSRVPMTQTVSPRCRMVSGLISISKEPLCLTAIRLMPNIFRGLISCTVFSAIFCVTLNSIKSTSSLSVIKSRKPGASNRFARRIAISRSG